MPEQERLHVIRERIDALDRQIQALIAERARCAQEVAKIKQIAGGAAVYYRPEREAQVLRQVMAHNHGPLSDADMARLFREIMSACLALEEPLRIVCLGPEQTFTRIAALKHFGHSVNIVPLSNIDVVFREVESGAADFGVVPVENSIAGVVHHTLDLFVHSPLNICGEVQLRIRRDLVGSVADTDIEVEDDAGEITRFLVVGARSIPPSGQDKTAVLVSANNCPGLLYRLLEPIARHGLSMTRIESRPARRGTGKYMFFIDLEGHRDDPEIAPALAELEQEASLFRVLGSYPDGLP